MLKQRMAAFLVLAVGLAASGLGCSRGTDPWGETGKTVRVVTTIAPLNSFVQNVGGDHVSLICLCTSQGPHHFSYDIQQTQLLRRADLFLAIGLQLDDTFADKLQQNCQNPQMRYVKLGDNLPHNLLLHTHEHEKDDADHDEHEHGKDHDAHEHEHEHGDEHGHHHHHHGEFDPHVWLGIEQACKMVEMIRDELKKVDSDESHHADYDRNAADYVKSLQALQDYSKKKLADKKNRKLLSFHESLRYFARSFGVEVVASIEEGAGDEPAPARIAELVKLCREKGVHVIAVEPQFSPEGSAAVLERELKKHDFAVRRVMIDPLETVDSRDLKPSGGAEASHLEDRRWYETHQRANIDRLAQAFP